MPGVFHELLSGVSATHFWGEVVVSAALPKLNYELPDDGGSPRNGLLPKRSHRHVRVVVCRRSLKLSSLEMLEMRSLSATPRTLADGG